MNNALSTRRNTRLMVSSVLLALEVYHSSRTGVYHQLIAKKMDALIDGKEEKLMERLENEWNALNSRMDEADKINLFMQIIKKTV